MGMCKECKEVFNSLQMRNGLCKSCMSEEDVKVLEKDLDNKQKKIEDELIENSKKYQHNKIVDIKFVGIFILLVVVIFNLMHYYIQGTPDNITELFGITFIFLIVALIHAGFMALIGLIKELNTSNKVWLISSVVFIIITLITMALYIVFFVNGDYYAEEESVLWFISPLIIIPKLAFMIRDYFNKKQRM